MRVEIARLHKEIGATMIYVTHDQVEAMTLADKIVVLRAGRIEQVGAPMDLYNDPDNRFVAGFIGSPSMNFTAIGFFSDDGSQTPKADEMKREHGAA
jgi:lactose/L-arabinose transport system ATP-binding protein